MKSEQISLSTTTVPPAGIEELGIVSGSCVVSTMVIHDLTAIVRNFTVGGELKQYTRLLDKGLASALERLTQAAVEKGASGVYGIQFIAPQVAGGAAEVVAVGTAYRKV